MRGGNGGVPYSGGLGDAPSSSSSNTPNFNWGEASGIAGLGSGLASMLFGGNQNPSAAAQPYLNQISGVNQQYLGPYSQMGQQAGNTLQGQYNQIFQNPGQFLNNMGQSYHQSPGFQFALHQALMSANNASAAGGMAGSPMNTQQNMQLATQMGNQDYYNWMNHAMNLYGQGLSGEQGMYGIGAESANNMAGNLSQALSQQAQAAYAGQENANTSQNSMFGNLMGGVGSLFGSGAFGL